MTGTRSVEMTSCFYITTVFATANFCGKPNSLLAISFYKKPQHFPIPFFLALSKLVSAVIYSAPIIIQTVSIISFLFPSLIFR